MSDLRRVQRNWERELPRSAFAASAAVHGLVLLLVLVTSSAVPTPMPPRTYRVNLVAAADERAPERLEPSPPKAAEEEHRPPPPEPTPKKPETKAPAVVEEKPAAEPTREPARAPEKGEEEVNINLEGRSCGELLTQPYCDNIARQVYRYWRRPTGGRSLSAELAFVIRADGSVSDIEWTRRSGIPSFDLEARGAIEAAGRDKAFGPLPDRYPLDRLRVTFFFDPSRL
ncbi:MAG: TonB C-terminal domain-containing protein [Gemmatimonadota bacterium]